MKKNLFTIFAVLTFTLTCCSAFAGPLAKVYITPQDVGLVTGAAHQFVLIGEDADGNPASVSGANWSANSTAGTINSSGLFLAGTTPGRFKGCVTVTVAGGFTASANVEVYSNEAKNNYVVERSIGSLNAGMFNGPASIALDRAGYIYVANKGSNTISKFDASGQCYGRLKVNYEITDNIALTLDPSYNLYVLDSTNCKVLKYDSAGEFVTQWGSAGSGNGQFNEPTDIAADWNGHIYVADRGNARIQIFDAAGGYINSWIIKYSNYSLEYEMEPHLIAIDAFGEIWCAISHLGNPYLYIARLDAQGGIVEMTSDVYEIGTYAGDMAVVDREHIYLYTDSLKKLTMLSEYYYDWYNYDIELFGYSQYEPGMHENVSGLAVDASGKLYTAETDSNRISIINQNGSMFNVLTSGGGLPGQLKSPSGVTVNSSGIVCVSDTGNYRVQQFGTGGLWLGEMASKRAKSQTFACPAGLTLDTQGNQYISDVLSSSIQRYSSTGQLTNWLLPTSPAVPLGLVYSGNYLYVADGIGNCVHQYNSSGGIVRSFGSSGTGNGQFNTPVGVATDSYGNVFVSDYGNNRIQKFNSSGVYQAIWGTTAQLQGPAGISIATGNSLFAADRNNCRIQKFTSSGGISTSWGKEGQLKFEFSYPEGVAVDVDNNLYVADTGNHRIMKYTPYVARPVTVSIQTPSNSDSLWVSSPTFSFGGNASGTGISSVKWSNDRGGSGNCSGTTSWTASGITLSPGQNVVAVKVTNSSGVVVTDSVVVTYEPALSDTVSPAVNITNPTTEPAYQSFIRPITISGTASDNTGVTSVIWYNSRGGSGTASGTTSWSISGVWLELGENVITVAARDASGNTSLDTITVNFGDIVSPGVAITNPSEDMATDTSSLTVTGTASDNVGVTELTWRTNYGFTGTVNNPTSPWNVAIPLTVGWNRITVTVRDEFYNSSNDIVNVYYASIKPTSIADAKKYADYASVFLSGQVVTAKFYNSSYGLYEVYIEEPSQDSGIRIEPANAPNVSVGDKIKVAGKIKTGLRNEKYIYDGYINRIGTGEALPLAMSNTAVGGKDWMTRTGVLGQGGITNAKGLNNIGMLVKTWGKITCIGISYLYVDDGSNLLDGTFHNSLPSTGIRVECNPTGYSIGDYVSVTGISTSFNVLSKYQRLIRTRGPEDVVRIQR